jgi:hypothetical protein
VRRFQTNLTVAAAICLAIIAIGLAVAFAIFLPLWFKPLAAVPLLLYARYGAGNNWVESGCLVFIIVAMCILLTVVIRHLSGWRTLS